MLPRWDQTHKDFAIACLPIRFVSQLYFDLIKNLRAFGCCEEFQIIGNCSGVSDLVHVNILPGHGTLLVCPTFSRKPRMRHLSSSQTDAPRDCGMDRSEGAFKQLLV